MEASITPVRKSRMYEDVMRQIQDLIDRGQLKAGERLTGERELAEQFQVNRATLRQALHALSLLRVLDIRPGDGVYVHDNPGEASIEAVLLKKLYGGSFTAETLRDVLEIRIFLEPPLAEKAAKHHTKEELNVLESFLKTMQESLRPEFHPEPFMLADYNFHAQIAKIAKNELIVRLMNSFFLLLKDLKDVLLPSHDRAVLSLKQHTKIFNAVKNGQEKEARRAMGEHLMSVEKIR